MISASDIFTTVRSFLDDDNSGRYTEADDLNPAINGAIIYLITLFNAAFDAKKLSPEVLRELSINKILTISGTTTKKVDISGITDLWTILGVDPDPLIGTLLASTTGIVNTAVDLAGSSSNNIIILTGTSGTANITAGGLTKEAVFDTDLTITATNFVTAWKDSFTAVGVLVSSSGGTIIFTDSLVETRNRWASRMSLEQWNDALSDPFSAGSGVLIPSTLTRAGYIGPGAYFGDGKQYLLIRPGSIFTADRVAVWYLKNPTKVTSGASQIEFPLSIQGLLVDKVLNYLSMQHGPDSKYGPVTEKEINQLVSLMLS